MTAISDMKIWVKRRDTPFKRMAYNTLKGVLVFDFPPIPIFHLALYGLFKTISVLFDWASCTLYRKPVFLCWLRNNPKRLNMVGAGLPYVTGPMEITLGDDCRVATQITIAGRTSSSETPKLIVGDNVGIGWGTGLYIGTRIIIGNNVRIAGQGTLAGYPGHPLDAVARARGEPDLDEQARDIILEDDVWLARGVIVNAGVTIGQGTVVAAGSVVTKDLPAGVLAGGAPARIIKSIIDEDV